MTLLANIIVAVFLGLVNLTLGDQTHGLNTASDPDDTLRYAPGEGAMWKNLVVNNAGIISVGVDGVLRSIGADLSTVIDYRQLDPEQFMAIYSGSESGFEGLDAIPDGRLVLNKEQLLTAGDLGDADGTSEAGDSLEPAGPDCHFKKRCHSTSDCQPYCRYCVLIPGMVPILKNMCYQK